LYKARDTKAEALVKIILAEYLKTANALDSAENIIPAEQPMPSPTSQGVSEG
jgi:hypothetical protein